MWQREEGPLANLIRARDMDSAKTSLDKAVELRVILLVEIIIMLLFSTLQEQVSQNIKI